MTYEEAIKVLTDTRVMILKGSGADLAKACSMAIEALEKQIPKKPDDTYEDSLDDECAVCGTYIFERDRYCPRCGQAIRWE